ncbi:2TM domain-containing protein [Leptolyngbya sp. CCY15150]|uniref:2TM domain-containing protein n=1 Tax=Leptolyngbya sp. CCY15150 TaxID=2767772 RepID=UPI00194FD6F6|nr:2TM domain-containing protein [Leptolyngbya sp. CCY15150]
MSELYSPEDVQNILQLAIARQGDRAELTHGQLLEIADELGISADDLTLAEQEWFSRQQIQRDRQEFDQIRRLRWQQHVMKYLIINIFLIGFDWISSGHISWSLYVLLGWGLGLSLDTWKTFNTQGEDYDRAFQKWQRQRQFKQSVDTFLDRILKPQS